MTQSRQLAELKRSQEQRESELLPVAVVPKPPRKRKKPKKPMKGKVLADLPKRKRIVELRVAGKTIDEISETMGLAHSTVYDHLRQWVTSQTPPDEQVAEVRRVMHERLEKMVDRHWQVAMGRMNEDGTWEVPPSREASEFLLRVLDREAKLMGVDMQPSQQTILISAESIAAYLGWDPQPGMTAQAVLDVPAREVIELPDDEEDDVDDA